MFFFLAVGKQVHTPNSISKLHQAQRSTLFFLSLSIIHCYARLKKKTVSFERNATLNDVFQQRFTKTPTLVNGFSNLYAMVVLFTFTFRDCFAFIFSFNCFVLLLLHIVMSYCRRWILLLSMRTWVALMGWTPCSPSSPARFP